MENVFVGKGKLAGKGVYAARDFRRGEIVKAYHLQRLTQAEFDSLPKGERRFVHSFWGEMYLFPEPSRFTNHSARPNVRPDLRRMRDIALRPIKKGEMITVNATHEVMNELKTFVEALEKGAKIGGFQWLKGGYRNAVICYSVGRGQKKFLTLKRTQGNWRVMGLASASSS